MKSTLLKTIFSALCLVLPTVFSFSQNDITGDWNGMLDFQGVMKLRLIFHIEEKDGTYTATLDSPDQNAFGIPAGAVTYAFPEIEIDMPDLRAHFKGTLVHDGAGISGTFTQAGLALPLELGREEVEKEVLNRPQEPQPPYPYHEEEVTFENKAAGITLAGTLTLPKGKGKYPVVVLVSGSGPQNRNEELLGHKPFLVIADHLTRQGIGVLRFDDRGVGKSTGNFSTATTADFSSDALAAVAYLKTRKDINKKQIGIAGHSEGGIVAPMCAARSKDVAFIILLAGPGGTGEEIILTQIELIDRAEGYSETKIQAELDMTRKAFLAVRTEPDTAKLRSQITAIYEEALKALPEEERQEIGDISAYAKQEANQLASPWFRFFLQHDPKTDLEKVKCPVLALNGEKDLQVEPNINLKGIEDGLKKGGNTHYVVKELPGLNHLFQECTTGSPTEYAKIEETFSPNALKIMSDWIWKTIGK